MKKLILTLVLVIGVISIVHAGQGAIATTDFVTGLTILQADNATPVPDGWLCQIMIPGIDGLIDPPNPDGSPGGDDFLVTGVPGNNYYQFPFDISWTGIPGQLYTPLAFSWPVAGTGTEPVANEGDYFYWRIFDAATVAGATQCLSTALYLLPIGYVDLMFNTTAHWDYGTQFNWQDFGGGTPPDPPVATAATTDFTLTFFANWDASTGATGYYLDVATDAGFTAFVPGYEDLDVLNVTTYSVTAQSAVDHYYRLRAYNASGTSGNSNVITVLGSTLPVELSAFTATYMENYTLIKWVTASETDVIGFNIYRSTEDVYGTSHQINIEHIPGHGTTTYPNDYEFQDVDQLIYETTYYYWLESVNYGGSSNVYGSINYTPEIGHGGFENDFDDNQLYNQPNPFSNTTTIKYGIKGMLISEPVNISIYNTLGQLILTDVAKNGVYQLDASELPTGVYFYRLETESYNNIKKMMIIR